MSANKELKLEADERKRRVWRQRDPYERKNPTQRGIRGMGGTHFVQCPLAREEREDQDQEMNEFI